MAAFRHDVREHLSPAKWSAGVRIRGWLTTITPIAFHDFAGSTVVHTIGGFISLAGAIALGPRIGRKFCAGGLSAMFYLYPRNKVWDCGITVNGFLAGLVAITCPCYWVSPAGAIILGAVAGVVCVLGVDLMEWLRIDDPVGAWPVHGLCGIWGTLSLGLLACGKYGASGPTGADDSAPVTGLFYGGGSQLLVAQVIGSASITAATFGFSLLMFYALKMIGALRVSKEGEIEGLDLHEHGGPAYPEQIGGGSGSMGVSSTVHTAGAAQAVAE